MNDIESIVRDGPLELGIVKQTSATVAGETLEDKLQQIQTGGLPYESLLLDAKAETEPDQTEQARILRKLFNFFLFGKRTDETEPVTPVISAVPALLYQYRDLARIRHDYPFCLNGTGSADAVCTLSSIIDALVAEVSDDSDTGERLKQHIYRIEPEIRSLANHDRTAGLLGLWDRAAKKILSSSRLAQEKKESLRDNLALARQSLVDSEMIACYPNAPQQLFTGLSVLHWQEKCASWSAKLDSLVQQLTDMLSIDFNSSAEAKNPEHLRDSTATDNEIDFNTMSSILATTHLEHQLPKQRSKRIQTALDSLQKIGPLFNQDTTKTEDVSDLPFAINTQFNNCAAAIEAYALRMRLMVEFFKAFSIAELELENRYQESVHDEFFSQFSLSHLSKEQLALCPPVLMCIKSSELVEQESNDLLKILASDLPIKVLLQIDELFACDGPSRQTKISIHWPARLANMAMAMTRAYVMQAPVSRLQSLHSGFVTGLGYDGPAIFSVYVGNEDNRTGLPAYFDASSAMESRLFPVFTFNPGKGKDLADRLDVLDNSQSDKQWPTDSFSYRSADEAEITLELKFTAAEFLFNDKRFTEHFWCIPQILQHENLLPLQEYIELEANDSDDKVPYILAVNDEGGLEKVLVTRSVVETVLECTGYWHNLQELGGINNSFALKLVAEETARLAEQKQQEVEAIEASYSKQVNEDIGKLTEEIIQRIAKQLILDGEAPAIKLDQPPPSSPVQPPPSPEPAGPAATDAAVTEQTVVEEDEDEELTGFDDAYIDTPLCTSCDDCTKLNGQLFAYDSNKQAIFKDVTAGTYKDLVRAAELCPVKIIHPGKPKDQDEAGLEDLMKRAAPFN